MPTLLVEDSVIPNFSEPGNSIISPEARMKEITITAIKPPIAFNAPLAFSGFLAKKASSALGLNRAKDIRRAPYSVEKFVPIANYSLNCQCICLK